MFRPRGPWWKQPGFGGIDPDKGYFKPPDSGGFEIHEVKIITATGTFGVTPQPRFKYQPFTYGTSTFNFEKFETEFSTPPQTPKRKREPSLRFLKDKEIDKLLDKYFNEKAP